MSVRAFYAKRKEPDEVVDLLRNVSLSPTKKVRVADSWLPTNLWPTVGSEPYQDSRPSSPQAAPLIEDAIPLPPSPPVSTGNIVNGAKEKAIVLYKPINPPLFPGGPPTGSSNPPFVVDTAGYLAACKGTGNNGPSTDAGHSSSAFASSSSDALSWTGLFEALDLQGGKLPLPGARRLQRTSSCSSLPRVFVSMDDTSMEEDGDPQTGGSQLALIPYSPPTFFVPSVDNVAQSSSNLTTNFPEAEEMVDDGDAMDMSEECATGDAGATEPSSQFGSPIPTFGSAQWEPSEIFKPPYSKIMSS